MELLAGWDRVRRNLVGTFFLQAKAELLEVDCPQPEPILLDSQTYSLPTTQLEREYRELDKWDDLLKNAREDYAEKQCEFGVRWRLCSEKNNLLQKALFNFDKYYELSKAKQDADRKLNSRHENELKEKTREVNRLKKELARMRGLKVELEQRLQISEVYREFMQSVVESSNGEFEEIPEIMARYEDLKGIREQHVAKIVKQVEMAFLLENELKDILQRTSAESVSCKTYLSQMEDYRHRLQISNWRRQDNLTNLKIGLRHELLMAHIPRTAIYNLYLLLCQEMEQPAQLQEHQFREQLAFVQRFLKELSKMSSRTKEFFECPSDVALASNKSDKQGVPV